jgi:hypothetical protein
VPALLAKKGYKNDFALCILARMHYSSAVTGIKLGIENEKVKKYNFSPIFRPLSLSLSLSHTHTLSLSLSLFVRLSFFLSFYLSVLLSLEKKIDLLWKKSK